MSNMLQDHNMYKIDKICPKCGRIYKLNPRTGMCRICRIPLEGYYIKKEYHSHRGIGK